MQLKVPIKPIYISDIIALESRESNQLIKRLIQMKFVPVLVAPCYPIQYIITLI